MLQKEKISIILISYNHEKYLRETIDSVLGQTYSNFEFIIWDDASTDKSWEIVNSYTDSRIKAFRNKINTGSGNINRAITQKISGDYIAIHHSDDIWEPKKLEKQIAILDKNPDIGAVFTWATIIAENGDLFKDKDHFYYKVFEQPNRTRYEWLNYFFYKGNALCHPSVLVRKKAYDNCGLYRDGLNQIDDFDMWVRLALDHEIYVIPEKLVRFRVHQNEANSSGDRPDSRIRGQFEYLQLLDNYKKISSFRELKKVFPEAKKYEREENEDLGFVLGMTALDTGIQAFTELFGLTLLFEALNNPVRAKKIKELYNFTHLDFIELTAKHDVFSVEVIRNLRNQLAKRDAQLTGRDAQLTERDAQLTERNAQLTERDAQLHEIEISKIWRMAMFLRKTRAFLIPPNSFRAKTARRATSFVLFPLRIRGKIAVKKNLQLLRESFFFDIDWYLAQNPDMAKRWEDPTEHYLFYGGFEGRDPSPLFSSQRYLDSYPDVIDAKINPLLHYLKYGIKEGRLLEKNHNEKVSQIMYEGGINLNRNIFYYIKRALSIAKHEGIKAVPAIFFSKYKTLKENFTQEEQSFPKISIVIPVYNALSMTKSCLASVYRETQDIDFEIILIDNASKDGTDRWLKEKQEEYSNLRVFRTQENIGFGPAVNKGFQHSVGEFVVILNNDTLVSHGWLNKLLDTMETDRAIGIISPVTNYVGEGPQIDKDAQELPADIYLINQHAKNIIKRNKVFYEENRLVFFCVLIRREVIDLIGGLDEGYEKGNFEDDDYCLRTRIVGYKLAIAKNSFVYHHGTVTFKKNKISHTQWMETNRRRFYKKAGRIATTLSPQSRSAYSAEEKMLSVIVRTKNRPFLLERTLTSLANQTRKDFEVVLINDGGEDVASLISLFAPFFHINYIHHRVSIGRTAAVNSGLEQAQGKWIAYLDDDDILYSWHFESLLQRAKNNTKKVFYSDCNRSLFARSNSLYPLQIVGVPPWEYKRQELLIQNYLPIHSYIHLRESIEQVGYWDESLDRLEDFDFLIRLSALHDFSRIAKVTCEYRFYLDNANSISNGRQEYLDALQHIYNKYPVDNGKLSYERQQVINALYSQSQKIEELLKNAKNTQKENIITQREIIRLTTGM